MSTIKSFAIENGSTYHIKHETNDFSIIDCNPIEDGKYKTEQHGSEGIHILCSIESTEQFKSALKTAEGDSSSNDLSPIITYTFDNGVRAIWVGSLETDFMESVEEGTSIGEVDILFAPRHGKPPKSWMRAMNPSLVVIGEADSDVLGYYSEYPRIYQSVAGDILLDCADGYVDVFASKPYSIATLRGRECPPKDNLFYAGSIVAKQR